MKTADLWAFLSNAYTHFSLCFFTVYLTLASFNVVLVIHSHIVLYWIRLKALLATFDYGCYQTLINYIPASTNG